MLQKEFYNAFCKCLICFKNVICEESRIPIPARYADIINMKVLMLNALFLKPFRILLVPE